MTNQNQPVQQMQKKDKVFVIVMLIIFGNLAFSLLYYLIPRIFLAFQNSDLTGGIRWGVMSVANLIAIWGVLYLLREYKKRRNSSK